MCWLWRSVFSPLHVKRGKGIRDSKQEMRRRRGREDEEGLSQVRETGTSLSSRWPGNSCNMNWWWLLPPSCTISTKCWAETRILWDSYGEVLNHVRQIPSKTRILLLHVFTPVWQIRSQITKMNLHSLWWVRLVMQALEAKRHGWRRTRNWRVECHSISFIVWYNHTPPSTLCRNEGASFSHGDYIFLSP